MVREPVDPNDPARISLKQSIKMYHEKVWVDLLNCFLGSARSCYYSGVAAKDLLDPHKFQSGQVVHMLCLATTGWFLFLDILFRRLICLELMQEDKEHEQRYRSFWMQLFCFPNPKDAYQRLAIRSIGSVENEMQAIFMKMSDMDKLITCRRNVQDAKKMNITGMCLYSLNFF